MYCVPSDFNLSASQYSDNGYNSVLIYSLYEYQSDCPISYEEYSDSVIYLFLNLIISNEYFDPSDIENPIRASTNDDYDFFYTPKFFNRYTLHVQKNSYEIDNGGIFSDK